MSIIKRQILYPGKKDLGELEPETKLLYHFETVIIDNKRNPGKETVIDDSRQMAKGQPFETIYGKQFKLPMWESCLSSMRLGEICRLTVRDDPDTHYICLNYVITSKVFRKFYGIPPTEPSHLAAQDSCGSHSRDEPSPTHNCSMSLRRSPYKDLNDMIRHPPEIFVFTFELIDVIRPKDYTKDIWQMSDEEKLSMLPKYREDGNKYYTECNYEKAACYYSKGLTILESLALKVSPNDYERTKLDELRLPFLLNMAQVKLAQGEYYGCIKLADEALQMDPTNIKALFRRAKAHAAVWNIADAKNDLKKCLEYDGNMSKTVAKCYHELKARESIKNREDRERFGNMFCASK